MTGSLQLRRISSALAGGGCDSCDVACATRSAANPNRAAGTSSTIKTEITTGVTFDMRTILSGRDNCPANGSKCNAGAPSNDKRQLYFAGRTTAISISDFRSASSRSAFERENSRPLAFPVTHAEERK